MKLFAFYMEHRENSKGIFQTPKTLTWGMQFGLCDEKKLKGRCLYQTLQYQNRGLRTKPHMSIEPRVYNACQFSFSKAVPREGALWIEHAECRKEGILSFVCLSEAHTPSMQEKTYRYNFISVANSSLEVTLWGVCTIQNKKLNPSLTMPQASASDNCFLKKKRTSGVPSREEFLHYTHSPILWMRRHLHRHLECFPGNSSCESDVRHFAAGGGVVELVKRPTPDDAGLQHQRDVDN